MTDLSEWQEYPAIRAMYDTMRDDILANANAAGISGEKIEVLELGVEEMLTNIISYAYTEAGNVWIRARREEDFFRLDFADHGQPFDPLAEDRRHLADRSVDELEEGGLGIYLVRENFDRLAYTYEDFQGAKANMLSLWLKLI